MSVDFLRNIPLMSRQNAGIWTGAFDTNNTSTPDGVDTGGVGGLAVARSGAGTYTVTFPSGSRPDLLLAGWGYVLGDDEDLEVRVTGYASGVLTIKVYQSSLSSASAAAYTTGVTVESDTATAAAAGEITFVESTAGDTTGVFTLLRTGTPSTTQCTVTYSAGVPTLTFAAADAVTECAYLQVPRATASAAAADSTDKRIVLTCLFV